MSTMADGTARSVHRARAWIYAALNPLEDALETERAYLKRGNPTWRFHTERLEFVRPPDEYLLRDGQRILRDLRGVYPDFGEALDRHGQCVEQLEKAAGALYRKLLDAPGFPQAVREKMHQYVSAVGTEPWAGWGDERMIKIVAERVVNQAQALPPHYFDADFWSRYGESFRRWGEQVGYGPLRQALHDCSESTDGTLRNLDALRQEIVDTYDVPPADVPGVWGPEEA